MRIRTLICLPAVIFCLCIHIALPAAAAQKKASLTMQTLQGAWHADSKLDHPYYILFLEMNIKPGGQAEYALIVPDELHRVMQYCKGQGTATVNNGHATITLEQGKCLSGDIFGQSRFDCTAKDAETLTCTGYTNETVQWRENPAKRGDIWYQSYSHIPGARKKTKSDDAPR